MNTNHLEFIFTLMKNPERTKQKRMNRPILNLLFLIDSIYRSEDIKSTFLLFLKQKSNNTCYLCVIIDTFIFLLGYMYYISFKIRIYLVMYVFVMP